MCSNMWAEPRRSRGSSLLPAWYQTWTATTGAASTGNTATLRPFGSSNVSIAGSLGWGVAAAGPASANRGTRGKKRRIRAAHTTVRIWKSTVLVRLTESSPKVEFCRLTGIEVAVKVGALIKESDRGACADNPAGGSADDRR